MTVPTDMLGMSDEDFLNLNAPPEADPSAAVVAEVDPAAGDPDPETDGNPTPAAEGDPASPGSGDEPSPNPEAPGAGEAVTTPEGGAADPKEGGEGADGAGASDKSKTPEAGADPAGEKPAGEKPAEAAPQFKTEELQELVKPFKANGRMVEIRSIDEARSLMQMGANFTRKMQELKPYRSSLQMLQNNNLLDPAKLSFLIDLDKGDPEAVKKFIKDRGIDPLDIDVSTDPAYQGGDHLVTDKDVMFRDALADLRSTPAGQELMVEIDKTWDDASKEMLYEDPTALASLAEARESGVFALIAGEVERRRTVGSLGADVPFLQAYAMVGQAMLEEQKAKAPAAPAANADNSPSGAGQPQSLGTSVAAPKAQVGANDKAAAASPSRGTATQAETFVNPLAMSDDEFLAKMENRV